MSPEKRDDLDALIIRNLGDLDAAADHLWRDLEPRIQTVIVDFIEKWAGKREWKGEYDWAQDIQIGPPDWKTEEGWRGCFVLDAGPDDTWNDEPGEDCFWLSRLCQKGRGKLGFRWYPGILATPGRWKKFVFEKGSLSGKEKGFVYEIGKKGFACEEKGRFFMEFKIDADKLIAAIQDDDFVTALQPMQDALDKLAAAKPEFDVMRKLAENTFR
jgi:hypothetical protein